MHSYFQKTEIGKTLGKLRAHSNKGIAQKAKEVVKKWKDDVQETSAPSKSNGSKAEASKPEAKQTPTNNATDRTQAKIAAPARRQSGDGQKMEGNSS